MHQDDDPAERVSRYAEHLLAALTTPALVRDRDGRLLAVNEPAVRLLGLSRGPDGRWRDEGADLFEPDGTPVPVARRPTREVLATGQVVQGRRLRVTAHDGSLRDVEADARPLVLEDGRSHGVVLTVRDVTEQVRGEERLRFAASLLEAVGQAVIATDAAGTVTYWNRAAQDLYGWRREEALGRPVVDLTPALASREQAEEILTALRAGLTWTGEFAVRRRDGSTFTALVTNRPLLDDRGEVTGVIGVSTDVTERRQAELATRRLAAVLSGTSDAAVLLSTDGRVEAWNPAAERLYGWSAAEVVGRSLLDVMPAERHAGVRELLARVRAGEVVRDEQVLDTRRDGSPLPVSITVVPVRDPSGDVVAASVVGTDQRERCALEQALDHATLHDALTGLPNRAMLAARLDQAAADAERAGRPVAAVFVDVDDLKDVNDAEGHVVGDEVLVEVAVRLREAAGPEDTVARFGGDSFVVLLPGRDQAAAQQVAAGLLEAVRAPFAVAGRRLRLSASAGVAAAPEVPAGDLLRAADSALYEAKCCGRALVRGYEGQLSEQAHQRVRLLSDLRDALDRDLLALHYQPVVELASGRVVGVEALLRWPTPGGGDLPPSDFVPLAERSGLARALDEWVVARACTEFAALRAEGRVPLDAYVAVNVTAVGLVDAGLLRAVRRALGRSGLPPQALVLEVTETSVMQDVEAGVRVLRCLAELGVRTALDDFGTGWASLTYVRRLPATVLKLDRSFVAGLPDDQEDLAITASVLDLARATGMTVVAEGVETAAQAEVLRGLGCHAGQGWFWQAAVPAADLPRVLPPVPAPAVPRGTGRAVHVDLDAVPTPAVLRLWELHAEGASFATIAAALNREGYRTPRGQRWHPRTVARLLAAPALARAVRA